MPSYIKPCAVMFKSVINCSYIFVFVFPRGHTLAYVPKYGKVYAFGLGGSGQLGLSSTENKNSPFAVPGPFAPGSSPLSSHSSMQIDSQGPELRVRCIHAGGDHSFVIADDADVSSYIFLYK